MCRRLCVRIGESARNVRQLAEESANESAGADAQCSLCGRRNLPFEPPRCAGDRLRIGCRLAPSRERIRQKLERGQICIIGGVRAQRGETCRGALRIACIERGDDFIDEADRLRIEEQIELVIHTVAYTTPSGRKRVMNLAPKYCFDPKRAPRSIHPFDSNAEMPGRPRKDLISSGKRGPL